MRFKITNISFKHLILISLLSILKCKKEELDVFNNLDECLNKDSIYIFTRGTNTKQGYFAREFNLKDTLSSHLGIGIFKENKWIVHHVADFNDGNSDLRGEPVGFFFNVRKENIFYGSIWLVKNLNNKELERLKNNIRKKENIKISFDKKFCLNDSSKQYCSQFVGETFKNVNTKKFNITKSKSQLKGIYKSYFQKDSLIYYPVDGFQINKNFVKVYEWKK